MNDNAAQIENTLRDAFNGDVPDRLGIAVSGGGDSMALMYAASRFFGGAQTTLCAATVDHGLRPEAASEAEFVKSAAGTLGLAHNTLTCTVPTTSGNLQSNARDARYQLLSDWAVEQGIQTILLGHTADDQAETVLMRLGRSAGVDGLAAMSERQVRHGITYLRPLLTISRAELRAYLSEAGIEWIEDPSNLNEKFMRIRVRNALDTFEELGISVTALNDVAGSMQEARQALQWYTHQAAQDMATIHSGDVALDPSPFLDLPKDVARRLLIHSIRWVSGASYPPRRKPQEEVLQAVIDGEAATLSGCQILRHNNRIWICREYNAVKSLQAKPGQPWDRRWSVAGPDQRGITIRALGHDGLSQCPDWRETGRPRASLLATPSVWKGEAFVAAPLAGQQRGWQADLIEGDEEFYTAIISH